MYACGLTRRAANPVRDQRTPEAATPAPFAGGGSIRMGAVMADPRTGQATPDVEFVLHVARRIVDERKPIDPDNNAYAAVPWPLIHRLAGALRGHYPSTAEAQSNAVQDDARAAVGGALGRHEVGQEMAPVVRQDPPAGGDAPGQSGPVPLAAVDACSLGYLGCREDHSAEHDVNVHRQRPTQAAPEDYNGKRVRVGDRDGHVTEVGATAGRVSFAWGQPSVHWHRFEEMRRYILEPDPCTTKAAPGSSACLIEDCKCEHAGEYPLCPDHLHTLIAMAKLSDSGALDAARKAQSEDLALAYLGGQRGVLREVAIQLGMTVDVDPTKAPSIGDILGHVGARSD